MADKDLIRDSLILHLNQLEKSGVKNYHKADQDSLFKEAPTPQKQYVSESHTASAQTTTLASVNNLSELQNFIGDCTRCKLCENRTNIVFGAGNPKADLMFIGEGPGADEDKQGIPFVGRAGQLLTKMIQAMGYTRDDVYIANVVKCRPPGNRNPEPDEVGTCSPFLEKQIELIQPKVIVALGKFAAQTICQTQIPISKLRGKFRKLHNTEIMPTFHPSYLLRNPEMKRPVWEDLKKVMVFLKENVS